ncbi:MAG TPA: sugar transferase [Terriglobales bacterium]|nr:sugar transferase [Terriglobales bacterium]
MNEVKRRFLVTGLKLFDLGLTIAAFALATVTTVSGSGEMSLSEFLSMRIKLSNFLIFTLLLFGCHLIFVFCGLYESKRQSVRLSEITDCVKATTLATLAIMLMALVFHIRMITPYFLVSFWLLSSSLFVICRLAMRYLLESVRRRGRNLRYILILGTNARALQFAQKIENMPAWGYRVLGFVDEAWQCDRDESAGKYDLCCGIEGLAEYLRRNVVDEVAIYLPLRTFYEHVSQVAALCELHGIIMRFDPAIFNLSLARAHAHSFDDESSLITTYASSLDGWPAVYKRILDFVLSVMAVVLLSPLMAAAALAIKATSPGKVMFKQDRIGLNKRRFKIYKFRTMVENAEKLMPQLEMLNEVSGPVFKIKNDPRMTPIGRILRRTSIDELPQLFNVIKGDMSLVGPRPLPVRDYEGFSEDWQRRRFSVRPGITCLWQVAGRSTIGFDQWMELDLQYVDQWSLWLDLKILARTIPAVVRGSGAA